MSDTEQALKTALDKINALKAVNKNDLYKIENSIRELQIQQARISGGIYCLEQAQDAILALHDKYVIAPCPSPTT